RKGTHKASCSLPLDLAHNFVQHLLHRFELFHHDFVGARGSIPPAIFFDTQQAQAVADSFDQICRGEADNATLIENAEGVRMREALGKEVAELKAKAALRQQAERQGQANTKAAEQAQQRAVRAAERLRVAEDRAKEKELIMAERAAERAWIAEEKKATKALEKQRREAELAGGRIIAKEDTSNNGQEQSTTRANSNRAHMEREKTPSGADRHQQEFCTSKLRAGGKRTFGQAAAKGTDRRKNS
ncbi:hypothetical protein MJO29_000451, partial [Puccinia striiformis f. sp. tritici]